MPHKSVLLSMPYFGPIAWYAALLGSETVYLESAENFQKQSFRNRTYIVDPNRVLPLIIPVVHQPGGTRQKYADVAISYASNWQKDHWKALEASYRSSPYFEYYEDFFRPLYTKHAPPKLLEFNRSAHELCIRLLDIDDHSVWTDTYRADFAGSDLREMIHPKKKFISTPLPSYQQVFSPEESINPNVSILDLLFNKGPQAREYLLSIS